MGIAVAPGRIAIGTRAEVLDYRDFAAVAAYLRANNMTVTCDAETITVNGDPPAPTIPRQQRRPPPKPFHET